MPVYATYGIYNLEAIIRKQAFTFIGRLCKSGNTIVQTLENAWIIGISLPIVKENILILYYYLPLMCT